MKQIVDRRGVSTGFTRKKITAIFRSGQRHIEQPETLRQRLLCGQRAVKVNIGRTEILHELPLLIVEHHHLALVVYANPEQGAEDHRVLKPLADMDGDNLDRCLIRFKANLVLLLLLLSPKPFAEPGNQPLHAQSMLMFLPMEQLKTMQNIGEPPLSIRITEQAPANPLAGHQLTAHHHTTPLKPKLMVVAERPEALRPQLLIIKQRGNLVA